MLETRLKWKDQNGTPIYLGDKVLMCEPGYDSYGEIAYMPDMGRYMLRVTHKLYHGCGQRWQDLRWGVECWRALDGRRRVPLTRRLTGVYVVAHETTFVPVLNGASLSLGGYAPGMMVPDGRSGQLTA